MKAAHEPIKKILDECDAAFERLTYLNSQRMHRRAVNSMTNFIHSLTFWGSNSNGDSTGSRAVNCLKYLWGQRKVSSCKVAVTGGTKAMGILGCLHVVDSSAVPCHCEVSSTVSNRSMQVVERKSWEHEPKLMQAKKTSLLLCPRSGDFEPSGHALRKSDNAYRASLTNDIKNLQILLDLHVNGFKSLVKCDATMCPCDDCVCPGVYEDDEWSAMPWNVQEIKAYRMASVSYVFEHIIQRFKRQEQIC